MSVFKRRCRRKECRGEDGRKKTCKHGRWYYEFELNNVRYRGAIPEARIQSQAEQAEIKVKNSIFEGKFGTVERAEPLLSDFIDKTFMPWSKKERATWRHDEFRCQVLKKFFRGKRFSEITPLLVVSFINNRLESKTVRKITIGGGERVNKRRSPTTVRKEFNLLKEICQMAVEEDVAVKNPCRKVPRATLERIPARNRRERFLDHEEERRLFEKGLVGRRKSLRPVVALALNTGVRRGGLLSLEREHVNLSDQSTFVETAVRGGGMKKMEVKPNHMLVVRNKRGKPYTLPLNQAARTILAELLGAEGSPRHLFTNPRTGRAVQDIKKGFAAACLAAGLDGFTFHDLRHTFATRLKEAGVDPITRRDLLGHASTVMTDSYTHSAAETKQAAVDLICPSGVLSPLHFPAKAEQPPRPAAVSA
jgi:integrase